MIEAQENPNGSTPHLCECGCGQPPPISSYTAKRYGVRKGQARRFIYGHNLHRSTNPRRSSWGRGRIRSRGYWMISQPDHPRANSLGFVFEHIIIAEKALGKPIPLHIEVCHPNGDSLDNSRGNLVVGPKGYSKVLYKRLRALRVCGNPNARQCQFCRAWGVPDDTWREQKSSKSAYHNDCSAAHYQARKKLKPQIPREKKPRRSKKERVLMGKYWALLRPDHPKAVTGYVREHILIAEAALGKPLPPGAVVHHVNLDDKDNSRGNHVICPSHEYHALLHYRLKALRACGNPNYLWCGKCKAWNAPDEFKVGNAKSGSRPVSHITCPARKRPAQFELMK